MPSWDKMHARCCAVSAFQVGKTQTSISPLPVEDVIIRSRRHLTKHKDDSLVLLILLTLFLFPGCEDLQRNEKNCPWWKVRYGFCWRYSYYRQVLCNRTCGFCPGNFLYFFIVITSGSQSSVIGLKPCGYNHTERQRPMLVYAMVTLENRSQTHSHASPYTSFVCETQIILCEVTFNPCKVRLFIEKLVF